jgi:hypothetical protein
MIVSAPVPESLIFQLKSELTEKSTDLQNIDQEILNFLKKQAAELNSISISEISLFRKKLFDQLRQQEIFNALLTLT